MPYSRKQAIAIFLNIKRKGSPKYGKGEEAAKSFGKKHRTDFRKRKHKRRRRASAS